MRIFDCQSGHGDGHGGGHGGGHETGVDMFRISRRSIGLRGAASVVIAGCLIGSAAPALAAESDGSTARPADVRAATSGASVQALDADYYYVWTPSHKQERNYWCGPATVQVIDDYWGASVSQQTYANYMGTTTDGTDFSRVDNAIRYYTGQSGYNYYGGLDTGALSGKIYHSLFVHHSPMAVDVTIDEAVWPIYEHNHAGHIIPVDGFSWVYNTVRVNDVYNEADHHADGGATYGHHTYPFSVIADGISSHWRHAVVCPG